MEDIEENKDETTNQDKNNNQDSDENLTGLNKILLFFSFHWRGVVALLTPILASLTLLPLPPEKYQWCAYTLIIMTVYWVTEAIPLPVTSFLPVAIFPLAGLMSTAETCMCFMNDTILMFIAGLFLAYAIEQSGLHKRLALNVILMIGFSHKKLLLAMSVTTMFISFWITNTAATTMMIPINFAVLQVFENRNTLSIYDINEETGAKTASDITTCYFCAASFSASIGGIATLVGSGTNLALKGIFTAEYPDAPEYFSFPLFSAFGLPLAISLEMACYLCLAIQYLGLFRPNSRQAKETSLTQDATEAVKETILLEIEKLGKISFGEIMVAIIFSIAMLGFFLRSPQMFVGWGDKIKMDYSIEGKYIQDSTWAYLIAVVIMLLPFSLDLFNYFSMSVTEDELPMQPIRSMLDWNLMAAVLPFSFVFLLGGGFAISEAAKQGLNEKIGKLLSSLRNVPTPMIVLCLLIFTMLVTNVASNVAVCNVLGAIAMSMASEIHANPLLFAVTVGFTASFCFMLPVGTPGNIIIQGAASIPTMKMIKTGAGPSLCTIVISWLAFCYWSPVVWPDINTMPEWIHNTSNKTA